MSKHRREGNETALADLLELRKSGITSVEIAEAIGFPGCDKVKKQSIITAFRVLAFAGVDIGQGRTVGKRGPAKAKDEAKS